jgi:hypothetical protein
MIGFINITPEMSVATMPEPIWSLNGKLNRQQ